MNEDLPVKPGMGLSDEGILAIIRYVKDKLAVNGLVSESDISGWDFTMQEPDFKMDADRRIYLASSEGTVHAVILRAHFYCMARKVMVLSNGMVIMQVKPGIMPSGWYNTSSTNSNVRCYDHIAIAIKQLRTPGIMAMGDDSDEKHVDNAVEEYAKRGKKVKMYNVRSADDFEFCSMRFVQGTAYPVSEVKQLINLLCYKPRDKEDLWSRYGDFNREMRYHPKLSFYQDLIRDTGWLEQL
jgi:hypothetical protein